MDHSRTHPGQTSGLQGRLQAWFDVLARRLIGCPPIPDVAGTNLADLPAPALDIQVVSRGEPAPRIRRPDLEGNIIDLSAFQGEPILLIFWSPGCGYCEELLPHILAFERLTDRLRLIVISGGAIGVNQELGFASPVVLDDDHTIAQGFGVTGTPAAVLIGAKGIVASEVARGATAVRAYVDRCHMPVTTPAPFLSDQS